MAIKQQKKGFRYIIFLYFWLFFIKKSPKKFIFSKKKVFFLKIFKFPGTFSGNEYPYSPENTAKGLY